MSEANVTINGTVYPLSPLRCKHLRAISASLADGSMSVKPRGVYSEIEKLMPYILDSVRVGTPLFDPALLDELTLQEFIDTWNALVAMSGIKVVSKEPVFQSAPESTGQSINSPIQ